MNIGRISVPTPPSSGLTFNLKSAFGYGTSQNFQSVTHRFGSLATMTSQTFATGIGPKKFTFKRDKLSLVEEQYLTNFYEAVKGSYKTFVYNAPNADKTTTPYTVIFDPTIPLSIDHLATTCRTAGLTFVECADPSSAPVFEITDTCTRFPSEALADALTEQVQEIIPLVHVKVRDADVPEIYLSDRLVTVGGNQYAPRLLNIGEKGTDPILSQNISGQADDVQFTFGNADRVMSQVANDCDLKYASIDICLYHVQSGILLQLWKGFVQTFALDASEQFKVKCSDGIFQIMQQYPLRTVSRTCWKTFDDGLHCPYSTKGTGGDPDLCDYTFDGENGCLSHGMEDYFGGVPVEPQGVEAKDNSTGTWGIGRNNVTATSIVSDTVWNQALPEIWCNDGGDPGNAFMTKALVVDYRNEGDFAAAIGLVGSGPIGEYAGMSVQTNLDGYKYVVAPMMDSHPPHGFKVDSDFKVTDNSGLGIRSIVGNDPTDDRLAIAPWPASFKNTAAGTAFVEIRISTPRAAILPTPADGHTITVPISKGLSGYVWDYEGNRTLVPGLTNPFWIAVNAWLRIQGLFDADSETQLATFDLASLVQPDHFSGCADIADLIVPKVVGEGTETQFVFNGALSQQKPFRDWLSEILSCCLGYYTFEFGRLKLGIRENSSTVSAFTIGNMLYQSLKLSPIDARFEKTVIDFADQAVQFEANSATYEDKDHSKEYGRAGVPLVSNVHSVGLSNVSQALRVAVTRTREEVGGINKAEWKAARNLSWMTTVLALDTGIGQINSVTHPDMPNGSGECRVTGWKLFKDWSIQLEGRSTTDSIYDLTLGPKPTDVNPAGLPILYYPQPQGEWQGYQIQAHADDALFSGEYTYDLAQDFLTGTDGTLVPQIIATGKFPVNTFIKNCPAPQITAGNIEQDTVGGYLKGGLTLRVSVCATDNQKRCSPPSEIIIVKTATGTDTNQFTINNIDWPEIEGLAGYVLFAHFDDDFICMQQIGTGLPTSITLLGPLANTNWAIPNPLITNVRLKAKLINGPGAVGEIVTSVAGNTVTSTPLIDPEEIDDWTGRYLMVVSRPDGSSPYGSWRITDWDVTTGKFTLDRSATVPHRPEQSILAGDGIVICYKGYDNSENPERIEDEAGTSSWQNYPSYVPHSGLVPSSSTGDVLRVLAGLGKGSTSKILDNDEKGWTLDTPITIDETSVWVIESGTWAYTADSSPIHNANPLLQSSIAQSLPSFDARGLLIGATTISDKGFESGFGDMPVRIFYVYGADAKRRPYPWQAYAAQPNETSYLDRTDWTFDVKVNVQSAESNDVSVNLMMAGYSPENRYSSVPQIMGPKAATMQVGGNIKGGQDLHLSLCAVDLDGQHSKPSDPVLINLPYGTDTNTASLDMTDVGWPATATGWDLFAGNHTRTMTHQKSGSGTPTTADLTLTDLNVRTYGRPDENFDHYSVAVKRLLQPSTLLIEEVLSVAGAVVTLGSDGERNEKVVSDYVGCRMFVMAKAALGKNINVFDSTVFHNVGPVFTLSEDASPYIEPGDVVGIYMNADISAYDSIGCSKLTAVEATPFDTSIRGNVVRIIAGTGEGQTRVITTNTATTLGIEKAWATIPDATSIFVVEEPSWTVGSDSSSEVQPTTQGKTSLSANVTNMQSHALLVMVQTEAADGTASEEAESPKRIVWLDRFTLVPDYECDFIFGQSDGGWADIAVGHVTNSPKVTPGGTFTYWEINAGQAPHNSSIVIDVLLLKPGETEGTSIFGPGGPFPELIAGANEATGKKFTGIQTIEEGDRLRAIVTAVGDTVPGQSVTLQIHYQ